MRIEGEDSDRHVDEEDPVPGIVVGDVAAEGWADRGGKDDGHSVHGKAHSALLRRKGVGENRLLARTEAATTSTLQDAEKDQHRQGGGESAEQRTEGEEKDASHVKALAAKAITGPGRDGQDNGVGDQVAGQDPGGFILSGRKRPGDVRQSHVRNRSVQHLHEGGQSYGHRHGPWIVAGAPAERRRLTSFAHRTLTSGSTERPGRNLPS